jgi:precorrin-6B methylase 2
MGRFPPIQGSAREREVMNTMLNMVSNGNRIVIDPIPESLKAELLAKELRGK